MLVEMNTLPTFKTCPKCGDLFQPETDLEICPLCDPKSGFEPIYDVPKKQQVGEFTVIDETITDAEGRVYPNSPLELGIDKKSPGQRAYEKYCEFQLSIPRMEIRPLTWEELGTMFGDHQGQWEQIALTARD